MGRGQRGWVHVGISSGLEGVNFCMTWQECWRMTKVKQVSPWNLVIVGASDKFRCSECH